MIFVRFRKPRWVPKAKSKIFRVREPTPIDPAEYEIMKEWNAHYNTALKSILRFLRNHDTLMEDKQLERDRKVTISPEEAYRIMSAKNAKWNEETGKIREAALAAEAEVDVIRKHKIAERDAREIEEIRETAREKVLEVQTWKESYVTLENLDDVVEEVLNTRTNYEFSLNPDGSVMTEEEKVEQSKT